MKALIASMLSRLAPGGYFLVLCGRPRVEYRIGPIALYPLKRGLILLKPASRCNSIRLEASGFNPERLRLLSLLAGISGACKGKDLSSSWCRRLHESAKPIDVSKVKSLWDPPLQGSRGAQRIIRESEEGYKRAPKTIKNRSRVSSEPCFYKASKALAITWMKLPELIAVVSLGGCRGEGPLVAVDSGLVWVNSAVSRVSLRRLYALIARESLRHVMGHESEGERLVRSGVASEAVSIASDLIVDSTLESRGIPSPTGRIGLMLASLAVGVSPGKMADMGLGEAASRIHSILSQGGLRALLLRIAVKRLLGKPSRSLSQAQGRQGRRLVASKLRPLERRRIEVGVGRGLARLEYSSTGGSVRWDDIIASDAGPGVYHPSYRRPSKRTTVIDDVVIPSRRRRPPRRAIVMIDASGSMNGYRLEAALREAGSISRSVGRITLILFDEGVRERIEGYSPGEKLHIQGYGGTRLYPALEEASREAKAGDSLIVMSDWKLDKDDIRRSTILLKMMVSRGVSVVLASIDGITPPQGPWRVVTLKASANT